MKTIKVEQLTDKQHKLYDAAVAARKNAYIPYSHFAVGAAVRCTNGKIYAGCNAVSAGERALETLCVVADTQQPVSPCGACRQVMSEFKIKTIILGNLQGECIICTLEDLLHYGFSL